MIRPVALAALPKPLLPWVEWPDKPFVSPRQVLPLYADHPWYPFEDFAFDHPEEALALFRDGFGGNAYCVRLCETDADRQPAILSDANQTDAAMIKDWLSYDRHMFWNDEGDLFLHWYSDWAFFALSAKRDFRVDGMTVATLFAHSENIFTTQRDRLPGEGLVDFLEEVSETWPVRPEPSQGKR